MKYYKTSRFTKAVTSTGFITITACALIAIGAITWFALSQNNTVNKTPSENSQQSYPDTNNSYDTNENTSQSENEDSLTDVDDEINNIPYVEEESPQLPEEEPVKFILPITGNISKGYSDTALQYSTTYGDMRLHNGVDILCEINSNIKSVGSGVVKSINDDLNFGKTITIDYDNNITVKYCGMGNLTVKENDKVAIGDIIGTSGEIPAECADNPHIHIEVFVDGKSASPLEALELE